MTTGNMLAAGRQARDANGVTAAISLICGGCAASSGGVLGLAFGITVGHPAGRGFLTWLADHAFGFAIGPLMLVSVAGGFTGLVLGLVTAVRIKDRTRPGRKVALAGLATSTVGVLLGLATYVGVIFLALVAEGTP